MRAGVVIIMLVKFSFIGTRAGVKIGISVDARAIVKIAVLIGLDCIVKTPCDVSLLAGELAGAITDGTAETDVDANVRFLARALT